jgi:mRNA interferase MazF
VALSGDFGRPRPALAIQADLYETTGTLTVLLRSSTLVNAPLIRQTVQPSLQNGSAKPSQIMIDKIMTAKRARVGSAFGRLDEETMLSVTRLLVVFLGQA